MSDAINPEAAQPSSRQGFEQSDRNPAVTSFGTDASGPVIAPASSEGWATQSGAAPSANAGVANSDGEDNADGGADEAQED
jgi:hypothetical protein